MLKSKKFKLQVSFEYFLGIVVLLSIFIAITYAYLDAQRDLQNLLDHYLQESNCYLVASKLNSLFPLTLKNITYYEEFYIDTKYNITVVNHKVISGNAICLTKVEKVDGMIKNGKNLIIIENGKIKIL